MRDDVTRDLILGGKVVLYQPKKGYRVAIDPIFLASFVKAREKDKVLDVGSGVGAASLSLINRTGTHVLGLEAQRELVDISRRNIEENNFSSKMQVVHGDLLNIPQDFPRYLFDHVMSNPPYFSANSAKKSFYYSKAKSNIETTVDLKIWINFCLSRLKFKGFLTLIFNAARLDALLSLIYKQVGEIVIFPLWPKKGKVAKRVLIRGRKGVFGTLKICNGMILHEENGEFTEQAKNVLFSSGDLDC